ncbi:MAG: PASTA domain-containing protein [Bacteroidetes bacterium]|nr:MAG: PASTA domain-containing protein [Bacteroidota bacterium]
MKIKNDIMWRIHLSFLLMCIMGLAIIVQIFRIQFVEGDKWKKLAADKTIKFIPIEASRGNIYADDGNSPLATSVPVYDIRIDTRADGLSKETFDKGLDSLAYRLSALFKDKTKADYKRELKTAYAERDRYFLIKRGISYSELQTLKSFPIFRLGRNKGGIMIDQRNVRELSFQKLAARTIGTLRDVKPVGIEAAYNDQLKGTNGKRLMQRLSGNVWMPVRDKAEIEPKDGNDLISTLDINIQDVAEQSLEQHLRFHNADHGCAILMEVETGEIKAIANLSKTPSGNYDETYNFAIGEASEPGSTFKMASLLVALDDGLVEPDDTVAVGNGSYNYFGQWMKDSHPPKASRLSVAQAFETSSNVGISRIISQHYAKRPEAFLEKLHSFGLGKPLGLEISGEGKPRIKSTTDKDFNTRVSIPWISIGYESKLTPLQMLAFYNAIANNGRMVRPRLVKELRYHGKLVKEFGTEVIRDSIARPEAIQKIRTMLEGVVENGTASSLNKSPYKIAGKTGTAQISKPKYGYDVNHRSYQASFVGYFPADRPKYSCIVVVYAPSNDFYYGGAVAAPIFKEIADKVFSNHFELQHDEVVEDTIENSLPLALVGQQKDIRKILAKLKHPVESSNNDAAWVSASLKNEKIVLQERKVQKGTVPNVLGMGAKDALYLLENSGLRVKVSGKGVVTHQSINAGSRLMKGDVIMIELG